MVFAWATDGILTLAPRLDRAKDAARTRGMPIPMTVTNGTGESLYGGFAAFNPAFLMDALSTFTSDTITLHLGEMKDGQISKPGLFTKGLRSPARIVLPAGAARQAASLR
ncbi:hypothetical protein ACFTUC_03100 [Streptomyces sp. NPDC056944]|uniref:hypothetical protein n=1 Tax=Streptomyces sp. NPDC056944 TaxID=3345972 RepID=UPI0036337DA8